MIWTPPVLWFCHAVSGIPAGLSTGSHPGAARQNPFPPPQPPQLQVLDATKNVVRLSASPDPGCYPLASPVYLTIRRSSCDAAADPDGAGPALPPPTRPVVGERRSVFVCWGPRSGMRDRQRSARGSNGVDS